jgi:hypothetical protein
MRRALGPRLTCDHGNPCICASIQYRPNVTLVFGDAGRLNLIVADAATKGARVVTGRGLGLGDSQSRMRRLYPASRLVADGPRYRWTRGTRGYVFDFSDGALSEIVAGQKRALLTDEYCG